jgi:hypothetical protein
MVTPRKNHPKAPADIGGLLGSNMDDNAGELPARVAVAANSKVEEERVIISLEDNDDIPPGGQFVGVDGVGFMLQPNQEVSVPRSVCDVLDHAIKGVPVLNPQTLQVMGYRDRLRFPYRVVTKTRPANSSSH